MFRARVLALCGDRSPSIGVRRPAVCRCTQATLPGKVHDCPFAPLCGHYLVRTIRGVRMLGCAIRFRCKPLEAGMMNPRQLSTVPAPLLRSVILATGVVGLLAGFGPAGIEK